MQIILVRTSGLSIVMCAVYNERLIRSYKVTHSHAELQVNLTTPHPEVALLKLCNVMGQQNWQSGAHAHWGDSIVPKACEPVGGLFSSQAHVELLAPQLAATVLVQTGPDLLRVKPSTVLHRTSRVPESYYLPLAVFKHGLFASRAHGLPRMHAGTLQCCTWAVLAGTSGPLMIRLPDSGSFGHPTRVLLLILSICHLLEYQLTCMTTQKYLARCPASGPGLLAFVFSRTRLLHSCKVLSAPSVSLRYSRSCS